MLPSCIFILNRELKKLSQLYIWMMPSSQYNSARLCANDCVDIAVAKVIRTYANPETLIYQSFALSLLSRK